MIHRSLLPESIVTVQQLLTDIWSHSECLHIINASGDHNQYGDQFCLVFVSQKLVIEMLLVVSDPSGGDAAPNGHFTFWVRIPHEPDLELLQRSVEVWADNIVNRLNLFEQFERQRFVANRSRFQFAEVNGFWIWCVHESIVTSTCDYKVAFRLICVPNSLRAITASKPNAAWRVNCMSGNPFNGT